MDPFERRLRDSLQNGPRVAFSDELHDQILRKAKQRSRIKRTFRLAIGSASVFAAAAIAMLLIPTNSSDVANMPQTEGRFLDHAVLNHQIKKPVYPAKTIRQENLSWRVAPVSVEQIRSDGRTVFATIKNNGPIPITNNEVQGILYFPSDKASDTVPDTWFYFVDGPNRSVQPGDSTEWEFHPTSVPSVTGKIDRVPQLMFVYRSQPDDTADSNVTWKPMSVASQIQSVSATGKQQQYLDIKLEVTNQSRTPLDLRQTMALVFFPKNETDENMDPFTYKYFADLTPETDPQLLSGKSAYVHVRLIGPQGVDLSKRMIRVQIVNKQMTVQSAK